MRISWSIQWNNIFVIVALFLILNIIHFFLKKNIHSIVFIIKLFFYWENYVFTEILLAVLSYTKWFYNSECALKIESKTRWKFINRLTYRLSFEEDESNENEQHEITMEKKKENDRGEL